MTLAGTLDQTYLAQADLTEAFLAGTNLANSTLTGALDQRRFKIGLFRALP